MRRHARIELRSRGDSALHRRHPAAKILAALALLIPIATLSRHDIPAWASYFLIVFAAMAIARLPLWAMLRTAAAVLPFALCFAVMSALAGDPMRGGWLLVRAYLSSLVTLLLIATTPMPALMRGLEWLRLPRFLVEVMQILYRYLFVLSSEALTMRQALLARGGSVAALRFRHAAAAVGVLFSRSQWRAQAVHLAMLARGFEGRSAGEPYGAVPFRGRRIRPLRHSSSRRIAGCIPMSGIVEVRNLSYTYEDGTRALDGVDFDLEEGARTALFGANGSGKTTFVHHLNGILRGTGSVLVDGLPVTEKNVREIRKRVGLVFQESDNQLFMPSLIEDVAFGPLVSGMPPAEASDRARAALERVGLTGRENHAPWHLSAGEKKRAAIAGILATEAKLLVLDEPTTYLDPPARRSLATLLEALPQSMILITHDAEFAAWLTGEAAFFEQGRIAAHGCVKDIAERFGW